MSRSWWNSSLSTREYAQDTSEELRVESQINRANFQCELCPKKFTRSYALREHLRTHADERPFACSLCSMCFVRKRDCQRHESQHSREMKFCCQGFLKNGGSWGCGRRFKRADALGAHFRTQTGRICRLPYEEEQKQERQGRLGVQPSSTAPVLEEVETGDCSGFGTSNIARDAASSSLTAFQELTPRNSVASTIHAQSFASTQHLQRFSKKYKCKDLNCLNSTAVYQGFDLFRQHIRSTHPVARPSYFERLIRISEVPSPNQLPATEAADWLALDLLRHDEPLDRLMFEKTRFDPPPSSPIPDGTWGSNWTGRNMPLQRPSPFDTSAEWLSSTQLDSHFGVQYHSINTPLTSVSIPQLDGASSNQKLPAEDENPKSAEATEFRLKADFRRELAGPPRVSAPTFFLDSTATHSSTCV